MKKKPIGNQSQRVAVQLLDNSTGKVLAPLKVFERLFSYLSVPVEGARYSKAFRGRKWDGNKHFITPLGKFKIGLFDKVVEFFEDNGIDYFIEDLRRKPRFIYSSVGGIREKRFRKYQRKAIGLALDSEIYGVEFPRGIIATATNSGKTLMSAGLYASMAPRLPFLFCTHRQEIFDQAVATFSRLFPNEKIGRYNADECVLENFTVAMITTLAARIKTKDVQAILSYYDVLVVDEAHHSSAKTWEKVVEKSDAYIKIALTGTALELDEERNLKLLGLFGPVIFEFKNKDMIKGGFSAVPDVRMINYDQPNVERDSRFIELKDEIASLKTKLDFATSSKRRAKLFKQLSQRKKDLYNLVYRIGIIESVGRNRAITDIVAGWTDRYHVKGKSVLIVVTRIDHGNVLHNWLNDCGTPAVFVSGESDKEVRRNIYHDFAARKIPVLIATTIYKEGIDIQGIDVLIIACAEKSPVSLLQFVGRGLRKFAGKDTIPVYDFNDFSHSTMKKHTILRRRLYEREKFTVTCGTTEQLTPARVEGVDL